MTNEQYSNMVVSLEKIEAKIDSLEKEIKLLSRCAEIKLDYNIVKDTVRPEHLSNFWNEEGKTKVNFKNFGSFHLGATLDDNCIWETIPAEQRNKPMGISCPCKRCSTYSMGI